MKKNPGAPPTRRLAVAVILQAIEDLRPVHKKAYKAKSRYEHELQAKRDAIKFFKGGPALEIWSYLAGINYASILKTFARRGSGGVYNLYRCLRDYPGPVPGTHRDDDLSSGVEEDTPGMDRDPEGTGRTEEEPGTDL